MKKLNYDRITTTIERQWLAEIIAETKKIEVTVLIHKIVKDRRAGEYQLHIKKVLGFKHWDGRRQRPKR